MSPLPEILERVRERRRNWHTRVVSDLPAPGQMAETCIVGSFSITGLKTKRRYLLKEACLLTGAGYETPSKLARDYLEVIYHQSPPATHNQILTIREGLRAMPAYVKPTTLTDGWYVDIQATYFSIMLAAGWNVDYWPGRWLSPGRPPSDFPWPGTNGRPAEKLARNCLVSAGLASRVQMWSPEEGYYERDFGNKFWNLQLYRLIVDILQTIAAEMIAAGACYVATDGYIMPSYKHMEAAVNVLASWGLRSSIKGNGAGVVRGPGAYAVGHHISKKLTQAPHNQSNVHAPVYGDWLRGRFAALAQ